jgi:hypothetical protein
VSRSFFANVVSHSNGSSWGPVPIGLLAYSLTTTVVILGVSFGRQFVALRNPAEESRRSFLESLIRHDGIWYTKIVTQGYHYDPQKRSSVAFFPFYPCLGSAVMKLTGLSSIGALVVVSHVCLAASFVLAAIYLRTRSNLNAAALPLGLLALGLMPASFFFRMPYSESAFLLLSLLFLLGLQRLWPLFVVALIAGLASACRPVGVGLLLPLVIYAWRQSPGLRAFVWRAALAIPVGCWGLFAYMAFLSMQFGDPLAFVRTQSHWGVASDSLLRKIFSLLSYEPIWATLLRGPDGGWSVFNWQLINPAYFVVSTALVIFGAWRGWLNVYEVTLAVTLLLIPYVTRAYEMNMASSARFATVIFPVYVVLGEGLARVPLVVSGALLAASAFLLGAFSALFTAGYSIF